jgi:GNAT superfamily N-acetyltransferase
VNPIRPTIAAETETLVDMTRATGLFRPMEVDALHEVLDDYHATNHAAGHRSVSYEVDGKLLGFAYYAPAAMTDRTWHLWWIVVRKDQQARGVGTQLLRFVEEDIRTQHRGRVLFIETGSMPHYELTRRFYLKNSYDQDAVLRDFYAAGDSMVVFRKELGD